MTTSWFVQRGGKTVGPLTGGQLRRLAVDGKLKLSDLVGTRADGKFTPAASVKGLFPPLAEPVAKPSDKDETPTAVPKGVGGRRRTAAASYILWSAGTVVTLTVVLMAAWIVKTKTKDSGGCEAASVASTNETSPEGCPVAGGGPGQSDESQPVAAGAPDEQGRRTSNEAAAAHSVTAVSPGGVRTTYDADGALWRAGMAFGYRHNRFRIAPEKPEQHADLLGPLMRGSDWRAAFARTIAAREYVEALHGHVVARDKNILRGLPGAVNRSAANVALQTILGKEPTWHEMLNENETVPGGFVAAVDRHREAKVAINELEIFHLLLMGSATDQIEARLRKDARPLPTPETLFVTGDTTGVITYIGSVPLRNVFVVARAKMKLRSDKFRAAQGLIGGINELFDPGAARNEAAARYLETSMLLDETPHAAYFFVPVIERGDSVGVPVALRGAVQNIQETKLSVFADSGYVEDVVLRSERDGPKAAFNLRDGGEARKFTPVGRKTHITLSLKGAAAVETCAAISERIYLPLGTRVAAEAGVPLEVLARDDSTFVAVGPRKTVGHAIILVPAGATASIDEQAPPKPPETLTVQGFKTRTLVQVRSAADGSQTHRLQTCTTLLNHVCTKTGKTEEVVLPLDQLLVAAGTWDDMYVVFLHRRAPSGAGMALVPKTLCTFQDNKKSRR